MTDANARIDEIVKIERRRPVHEGHGALPAMRLLQPGGRDPRPSRRDFETVDVLQDPEIRAGIKDYSDWPTVPQLYVKGEFVGGSDIMMEMFEAGELQQLLGAEA